MKSESSKANNHRETDASVPIRDQNQQSHAADRDSQRSHSRPQAQQCAHFFTTVFFLVERLPFPSVPLIFFVPAPSFPGLPSILPTSFSAAPSILSPRPALRLWCVAGARFLVTPVGFLVLVEVFLVRVNVGAVEMESKMRGFEELVDLRVTAILMVVGVVEMCVV